MELLYKMVVGGEANASDYSWLVNLPATDRMNEGNLAK